MVVVYLRFDILYAFLSTLQVAFFELLQAAQWEGYFETMFYKISRADDGWHLFYLFRCMP
jgi:hypothetical protein